MISGVDGVSSYRSMYAAGTASTRESTGTSETEETEGTGQVWDAVFTMIRTTASAWTTSST